MVFQPAEELGRGAQAMIDDGLFTRFGRPDVVLGQHVAPFPAGFLALRPGPAFAAADSVKVRMFGQGGHGSRPETTVDPVVMAAATVMRLQTVVSREVAGTDTAVVTVGALRAGTKENIIPDEAELLLSIRTFDAAVRDRVLGAITRIVRAEAAASGAPRDPEITLVDGFPAVVNDVAACARTRPGARGGGGRGPGGGPRAGDRQRGRRPARLRQRSSVRVLAAGRRRSRRVRRGAERGRHGRGGCGAAVEPLAFLRARGRADPRGGRRGVGRGRADVATAVLQERGSHVRAASTSARLHREGRLDHGGIERRVVGRLLRNSGRHGVCGPHLGERGRFGPTDSQNTHGAPLPEASRRRLRYR